MFKFELNQVVSVIDDFEQGFEGVVMGRAEYTTMDNAYLIRQVPVTSESQDYWWSESRLSEI